MQQIPENQPDPEAIAGCLTLFEGHGVRFLYPDIWQLEEQHDADDVTISVTSDGTCFWLMRLMPSCPSPDDVVDTCIMGLRDEYPDCEAECVQARLAEIPATAVVTEFSCLELLNSAWIGCVRTSEFTLLVMWQGTDHELKNFAAVFEQITASVRINSISD